MTMNPSHTASQSSFFHRSDNVLLFSVAIGNYYIKYRFIVKRFIILAEKRGRKAPAAPLSRATCEFTLKISDTETRKSARMLPEYPFYAIIMNLSPNSLYSHPLMVSRVRLEVHGNGRETVVTSDLIGNAVRIRDSTRCCKFH